jgi:O-antigen/teichoic acid export membrane protein
MISKKFIQSSAVYTVVGALPFASGFLLLPWFTHLLTPAQFGVNVLYISLMYLIQIFGSFGLDMSASIMYFDYKDDKYKLRQFIGTIFLGITITGSLTAILFMFGGFHLFNLIFGSADLLTLLPFGIITILSGVFNGVFKTYSSLLIYQQRPARFFWLNIINFGITIGASLGLLYLFPYTLTGPVLGRLLPAVISAGISVVLLSGEYGFDWDRSLIKPIFSVAFPLVIYALLTWIVSYVDRFIILRLSGDPVSVGIFDFAVKLVLFLELFITGLISTINPKVFSIWKEKDINCSTVEVNRYYNALTALLLLLIPAFVMLAPIIIPVVIKKVIYYQSFQFLVILTAGYASRVWFFMYLAPILFFKKTKSLPKVFLMSAVFQIIASTGLIYFFGLMGAVYANFLTKQFQALFMYMESRKIFHFKVNIWKIYVLPVTLVSMLLGSEYFITPDSRLYVQMIQLLTITFLVYLVYRKELAMFVRTYWRKGKPVMRDA